MSGKGGFLWMGIGIFFIGMMWLVCKPVFDALTDVISSAIPGATSFEIWLFTALPFIICVGLVVMIIIRFTGRNKEG